VILPAISSTERPVVGGDGITANREEQARRNQAISEEALSA
jgi:hypothetical protein